jgi:MoaA/NifB/PqqE/SkfB family radical SAM enzyme
MLYMIDMEVTNRCNAKCHFCPRDRTPHQGLMPPDVFEAGLERAVEFRAAIAGPAGDDVRVSLCGLGEPLLNRRVVDYCQQARAEGFSVVMSSNGSLLDERRSAALLEAGLQQILVNVGEEGDDYEEVYHLPFDRTLENVVRFNEMSAGACEVVIVLVDHRGDPEHLARMRRYWADHGIQQAISYEIMNRGGSLFVDHMQYEHYPELAQARARLAGGVGVPLCGAPFGYLFVGYDGQYYLCCSDWEKQTPLGSIFDKSFVDVAQAKLDLVVSRDPVCRTCNLDPINRLTEELRAEASGDVPSGSADQVLAKISADNAVVEGVLRQLGLDVPEPAPAPPRRLIPVRSV